MMQHSEAAAGRPQYGQRMIFTGRRIMCLYRDIQMSATPGSRSCVYSMVLLS